YDLHLEYWLPPAMNSGVSIRDKSRAHDPIGESDAERPDLAAFPKTTPAHIGYEIQIIDDPKEKYPSGSIYTVLAAKPNVQRRRLGNGPVWSGGSERQDQHHQYGSEPGGAYRGHWPERSLFRSTDTDR